MSTILFIFAIYLIWTVLDMLQIPNVLSIILIGLTVSSGLIYAWHKHKKIPLNKESFIGEWGSAFFFLLLITLFRSFVYEPFYIPSGSMEPTLRVGDIVAVDKNVYGLKDPIWQTTLVKGKPVQRDDIIVFKYPKQANIDFIKRVIGVEGDTVSYNAELKTLSIKNKDGEIIYAYSEPKANPLFVYQETEQMERVENGKYQVLTNPAVKGQGEQSWTVPEGNVFVMGDNRDNSEDSRFFGFVPEQNIVGKAVKVLISFDKVADQFPKGIRPERTWKSVEAKQKLTDLEFNLTEMTNK